MQNINLPVFNFKFKEMNGQNYIFDVNRKKFVVCTPEEWVRQNLVEFLVICKYYPRPLVAIEKSLRINKLNKRADVVVYNRNGIPIMIIECKASDVAINQEVFEQIARYNSNLKVNYLMVSNGLVHYCCRIDHEKGSFSFLQDVPEYSEL